MEHNALGSRDQLHTMVERSVQALDAVYHNVEMLRDQQLEAGQENTADRCNRLLVYLNIARKRAQRYLH